MNVGQMLHLKQPQQRLWHTSAILTGLLFKDIPVELRRGLAVQLNPMTTVGNDWRDLAEKLNISSDKIRVHTPDNKHVSALTVGGGGGSVALQPADLYLYAFMNL